MIQYKQLLKTICNEGTIRGDRTGTGTLSIFDYRIEFDLRDGFPACTTKKLAWNAVRAELMWFLSGSSNVDDLRRLTHGVLGRKQTIWDANYNKQAVDLGLTGGDLGAVYGRQWRAFANYKITDHGNLEAVGDKVDQIVELLKEARDNPDSRRLLVSAWNPNALAVSSLPPCHWAFELYIDNGFLDMKWHQRSVDVFLGLPFNIASYALLQHILAQLLGLTPRKLVGDLTNVHIYNDHRDQVKEQLSRNCLELPTLVLPKFTSLEELLYCEPNEFILKGYESHLAIKANMSA